MTESTAEVPSAENVLRAAVSLLHGVPDQDEIEQARALILLAREIRESAGGAVAREPDRTLTLHDVAGVVCSHGRVALRRKSAESSRWWMHADDGSNCVSADPETEHKRRLSAAVAEQAHERWIQDTGGAAGLTAPRDALTEQLDVSRLRSPALRGGTPGEVPQVEANVGTCAYCGQAIRYARRSEDHLTAEWYHDLTVQTACVRPLGSGHYRPTYAMPQIPMLGR